MVVNQTIVVEMGLPWVGWPLRQGADYEFAAHELPAWLVKKLEEWTREFTARFDESEGWDSVAVRTRHHEEALALKREVERVLGPRYLIELDPIGSGKVAPGDGDRRQEACS